MTAYRKQPLFRRAAASVLMAAALAAAWAGPSVASSHREGPFIATQPQVDGTDFYMFRSYEPGRASYVTIVANYLPLQDPYGGPNYFKLDPNAVYEIHITNGGGAVENLTFQFKFQTTNDDNQFNVGGKMVSIPIVQNGSVERVDAQLAGAQRPREVHDRPHPRPASRERPAGDHQSYARAAPRSTSRSTTSGRRPSIVTSPTRTSTSTTSASRGAAPAGYSSASARTPSSSISARPSTSSTSSIRRWS